MQFVQRQFTYREDRKEYIREVYQCVEDDVWVTVEVPIGNQKPLA